MTQHLFPSDLGNQRKFQEASHLLTGSEMPDSECPVDMRTGGNACVLLYPASVNSNENKQPFIPIKVGQLSYVYKDAAMQLTVLCHAHTIPKPGIV